jgi:hypothetical protein
MLRSTFASTLNFASELELGTAEEFTVYDIVAMFDTGVLASVPAAKAWPLKLSPALAISAVRVLFIFMVLFSEKKCIL